MNTIAGFDDFFEISSTSFLAAPAPTDNTGSSTVYPTELPIRPEPSAFQLLSDSLESMFDSPEAFYSDAKLVLSDDREVSFHRCILSARSLFFKTALAEAEAEKVEKSTPVKLELKKLATEYDVGFDSVVAVLAYVYSGRVRPPPKGVSECADESCCHVACRPAVDFMVEVLYLAFVFQIPELVTVYQRHLLDVVDKVNIEDTLVVLKLAKICGNACKRLYVKCRAIIFKSNVDVVSLKKSLPEDIAKEVIDIRKELGLEVAEPEKHVSNIHKALESDDLTLVDMLLKEGHTNLDEAYALHFAVAYCDVETATDLLKLDLADVNRRNQRGYTVLHVAAMRKEPTLIALLLTKGANASETSLDGRTALMIAKQVTKAAECCILEKGKLSPKGGVCVEILTQPDSKREPFPEDVSPSLAVAAADELKIRLIDLENRVQMAQFFFPMEAQVAMDIAQMKGTSEFMTAPDLYMGPFKFLEMHRSRLTALSRTVELGKRFFPRCSKVLDDVVDSEDLTILALTDDETPEQRQRKRQRYMEIHEALQTAFSKDNEEYKKSSLSASSSSTSKSSAKKRSSAKLSHRQHR